MYMYILTFVRPGVVTGVAAAVLAFCVLIGVLRYVLVTVILATLVALTKGDDADMINGRVVTVLAAKASTLFGWGYVLLALTLVALAPLDSLTVLHDIAHGSRRLTASIFEQS